MSFNQTDSKNLKQKWTLLLTTFCCCFFLAFDSGKAEELQNNTLPPSPDTGSPEENVAPGGTRKNHLLTQICGEPSHKIVYFLKENNIEFTSSAYPTFWFYFPDNLQKLSQIKFIVRERETGKKIYSRAVPASQIEGVMGIPIPPKPEYAVVPNVNYDWTLEVDCVENGDKPITILKGWLHRLPSNPQLQNQLVAVRNEDRYIIYLQHNLLYDALNDLAQLRIAEPNNPKFQLAWNQLLTELGWQDLKQKLTITPHILNQEIFVNNIKH